MRWREFCIDWVLFKKKCIDWVSIFKIKSWSSKNMKVKISLTVNRFQIFLKEMGQKWNCYKIKEITREMKKRNSFENFLIRLSSIPERILLLNSKFSYIPYKTETTYIVIQVHYSYNNSYYYASVLFTQFTCRQQSFTKSCNHS